ncbi:PrsW family glutamic-type intramembrane protease [Pontiellaceae bacterium B1224]|nr:PrsW family glutamic-type intramembrane protease [Pontiellaceae bacterium B1224]
MNNKKWFNLTRQTSFIWQSGAVLILIMLLLGICLSFFNTNRMDSYQALFATPQRMDEFQEELENFRGQGTDSNRIANALVESLVGEMPFYEKLESIARVLYHFRPEQTLEVPMSGTLSGEQTEIASALIIACADLENKAALQTLENIAMADQPPPDANFALALAYDNRAENLAAITALNREIDLHDSSYARERLVGAYLTLNKYDALEALARDPKYDEYITPYILQDIAIDQMDWPRIVKYHFASAYQETKPAMAILALLSGLVWAYLLIRFNGTFSRVWKFLVPALILGALSAHATLLCIFWLEGQFGMDWSNNVYQQLVYCLGIGLREEGMKLLLFVPLIPFLRKRSDLEILTVAGLVGLGFALEENINYFEASAGLAAVARFATANFLHIALTAMCGLTLARAFLHRGEDIQNAFITFVLAVAIHGFYDAFIMVPALMDYSWLTYTVFVLMGFQYFGWLRHLREEWNDPFSITATFTYGIIIVTGLTFILYAWDAGPIPAIQAVISEVISIAILLVLFYREIPETIR